MDCRNIESKGAFWLNIEAQKWVHLPVVLLYNLSDIIESLIGSSGQIGCISKCAIGENDETLRIHWAFIVCWQDSTLTVIHAVDYVTDARLSCAEVVVVCARYGIACLLSPGCFIQYRLSTVKILLYGFVSHRLTRPINCRNSWKKTIQSDCYCITVVLIQVRFGVYIWCYISLFVMQTCGFVNNTAEDPEGEHFGPITYTEVTINRYC